MMTYMNGKFSGISNNVSYQEDALEDIPEIEMGNILTNVPDLNDLLEDMPDFEINKMDILTLDEISEDIPENMSFFPVTEHSLEEQNIKNDTSTGFKEIFSNIISIFN